MELVGTTKEFPEDAWVAAPVKKGSLVLIHGQVKQDNTIMPNRNHLQNIFSQKLNQMFDGTEPNVRKKLAMFGSFCQK